MTQEIQINAKEIMIKLSKLQCEVDILKQKEKTLEDNQRNKFTIIDESMAEIWDNDADEIWNDD